MENKRAILVVSFGSSVKEALERSIFSIEDLIRREFPNDQVERAFTSNMVIRKLKDTIGLTVDTPREALEKLIEKGFQEIVVQPLHILPGVEFEKIQKDIKEVDTQNVRIKLGKPLLYDEIDFWRVLQALKTQITMEKEDCVLLVGHGTYHRAGACYERLQEEIEKERLPFLVGTIEDGIEPILTRLKEKGYREILMMPFLLVAGDHVKNDLLGEDEDSWKSILLQNGYKVKWYPKGLGENPAFRQLYLNRVKENTTCPTNI